MNELAWKDFLPSSYTENIDWDPDQWFIPWTLFDWVYDPQEIKPAFAAKRRLKACRCIIDDFFEYCGDDLPENVEEYIDEILAQPFSVFVVEHVIPGKQILLKDLLLPREFIVEENLGSMGVERGDIIFSRVVQWQNIYLLSSMAPFPLPPSFGSHILYIREKALKKEAKRMGKDLRAKDLLDFEPALRVCYFELVKQIQNPAPPRLTNTDGDEIIGYDIKYVIHGSPQQIFDGLKTLVPAKFLRVELESAIYDDKKNLVEIYLPWLGKDQTLLGDIDITKNQLVISVNSKRRSNRIQKEIARRLKNLVTLDKVEVQMENDPMTELNDTNIDIGIADEKFSENPEVQEQIDAFGKKYWQDWLDQPVPALDDETPRRAATTKLGREQLHLLLLGFEQRIDQQNAVNLLKPDIDAILRDLNL